MNLSAACIVYVLVVLSHCGSDGKLRGNRKRCLFYYVKTSTLLFLSFTLGLVYIRFAMNMDYMGRVMQNQNNSEKHRRNNRKHSI